MTAWNYRVVRTEWKSEHGDVEVTYSMREVFYQDGKPRAYSENPRFPLGESVSELKDDLIMMAASFSKPVLDETMREIDA